MSLPLFCGGTLLLQPLQVGSKASRAVTKWLCSEWYLESNVPMADQIWVIISTNIAGGTININAMRDVRFRDNQGSTAV